ncbi:hypothetical protein Sjap_020209 [Stephania japonica]|uniref:Uncharacterized protein n=1 Tax=Stephania japonica TaxID=461633 RepID=A0AAP0F084_9MAGN
MEQKSQGRAVKTLPRPTKVTASLMYELASEHHLHALETPPKPLDATASLRLECTLGTLIWVYGYLTVVKVKAGRLCSRPEPEFFLYVHAFLIPLFLLVILVFDGVQIHSPTRGRHHNLEIFFEDTRARLSTWLSRCAVRYLVEVGIGSKHSDASRGVENLVLEVFCNRRRGDVVNIPAYGVTNVHMEQKSQGHTMKTPPRPTKVMASLTYELGSEHHVYIVETPPKLLDATASQWRDTVHRDQFL